MGALSTATTINTIADRMAADTSFVDARFLRSGESFVFGGLRHRVELVSGNMEGGLVRVLAWDNENRSSLIEIPVGSQVEVNA